MESRFTSASLSAQSSSGTVIPFPDARAVMAQASAAGQPAGAAGAREQVESQMRARAPELDSYPVLGRRVTLLEGATRSLREQGMYPSSLPASGIDGLDGTIVTDCTYLTGEESHFGVMLASLGMAIVGVRPEYLVMHPRRARA